MAIYHPHGKTGKVLVNEHFSKSIRVTFVDIRRQIEQV